MKLKSDSSHSFINLGNLGRIDWQSTVLTLLLVKFISLPFDITSAIVWNSPIFSEHYFFNIPAVLRGPVFIALDVTTGIFGIWIACKKFIRRPFQSLISIDMKFSSRRCLLGTTLYFAANAISFTVISLFFSIRANSWQLPFGHFEWPHHADQIVEAMVNLVVLTVVAFAEELFFRGWLTQTVGHYIRSTRIVVPLVAVLFAAYHTQYDLRLKMLIFVNSLGFSALSLRDQRLELAIGAHAMINVCVTLQLLFFTGFAPHVQFLTPTLDFWTLIVLKGALPFTLMYGFLQKTRGWFTPANTCLASPANVQPRHLAS